MGTAIDDKKSCSQHAAWMPLAILFILVSIGLALAIVVIIHEDNGDKTPICGKGANSVHSRTIDLSQPDKPGPFHDLTTKEIEAVYSFVLKDSEINAKRVEDASLSDSVVYMMDLFPAKKEDVLSFLDGQGAQPDRQAKVIVFRGDLTPPMVHELVCGPLPNVTICELIKYENRRNPVEFAVRPYGPVEDIIIYVNLIKLINEQIGEILRESYGMTFYDCTPIDCLRVVPTPMGTSINGNITYRRVWLRGFYPTEYYIQYPIDFAMLANMDGTDPSHFRIEKIWYHDQFFETVDDFVQKYNDSSIKKTRLTPPSLDPKESFSSLFRRGDPLSETPQRPPTLVEPDGKRYSLKDRQVDYMGWKFNFRMSPFSGPSLSDIRFKGDRIAYELRLVDVSVFYSAYNTPQVITDYVDSGYLIGIHAKSIIPGADCPETATFINQTFSSQGFTRATEIERAFCLFENNNGYPLRRHLSYSQYEGAFYGGMLDSALFLRSILTIGNYDYVIEFIFRQTGALEVRVMSTGYVQTAFFTASEKPYGFHTRENYTASIHHHIFNFKVDLDVSGTSNRYETLDIKPEKVTLMEPLGKEYYQTKFDRTLYRTEKEALYKYNFDTPKYHIVHNDAKKTEFGEPKAYRLIMNGMSKQLLPENENNDRSVGWARHQMVVTRRKEDEELSSSPYAYMDSLDPVVNFTTFYDDDQDIVDEDLVFWITCGTHHIPNAEDIPVTTTVTNKLSFILQPYNYFTSCPSMASRDQIRISSKDPKNPKAGVKVDRNGNTDEQCKTEQLLTTYEESLKENPDAVLESRKQRGLF